MFLISLMMAILMMPVFVKAQENKLEDSGSNSSYTYTLLEPLPKKDGGELKGDVKLDEYMAWMYKFALALAGFLAVMMITIGGVEYIASGANEKYKSEATGRITNALWGLVLAFAAYLILYTINPDLVTFENNKFMNPDKTTETTTDSDTNNTGEFKGGAGGRFRGGEIYENNTDGLGENNKGVTDIKDLDFDFEENNNTTPPPPANNGNTGGATGSW